jgi:hypothetical protein
VLLGAGDAGDVLSEAVEPRALAAEQLPGLWAGLDDAVGKTRGVSVDRRDRRAVEALRIMELVYSTLIRVTSMDGTQVSPSRRSW